MRSQPDSSQDSYLEPFISQEAVDLGAILQEGLQDEIMMLRVFMRRMMALARGTDSLDKTINILGAAGLAATRLAGLLKTQQLLGGNENEARQAVADALHEILVEWKRIE
jgi:hypothetical protein